MFVEMLSSWRKLSSVLEVAPVLLVVAAVDGDIAATASVGDGVVGGGVDSGGW